MEKVAVVTGGNKGIGLEVVRQLAEKGFHVILTARDDAKGKEAVTRLNKQNVAFLKMDVTDEASVKIAAKAMKDKFGKVDVLINNAGVFINGSILDVEIEKIKENLETNTFGALKVAQAFIPLMQSGSKIINVSSGMGQLTYMNGSYAPYRISKTSLNAITRILSEELKNKNILVNSVCPGWVRTDMGGSSAERSVEKGAETIVWLALENNIDTGSFFRDKKKLEW